MIRAVFHIESQSNRADMVKASLDRMIGNLKKEERTKVRKSDVSELREAEGMFSATAEVEVDFQDFGTYLSNAIRYGPSAIEIIEPESLVLTQKEFLDAVGEVIRMTKLFFAQYNLSYQFEKGKVKTGLSEEEIDGLRDQGAIRAKIVVESKGKSSRGVINSFVGAVSGDVFVNKVKTKKMEKGEAFDGLVGIEAFMYEPKTLLDIAVKHTPVLVELLEPEEIDLSMLDLQDMGVELASIFFEAAHKIVAGPIK